MTAPQRGPIQFYEDPDDYIISWSTPFSNYVYEPDPDVPNYWVPVRMKTAEEMAAEKVAQIRDAARQKAVASGDKRRTAMYRLHSSEEELLYVGISTQPLQRWIQHAADKNWWPEVANMSIDWFDSRAEALAVEAHTIKTERPLHNVVHNDRAA